MSGKLDQSLDDILKTRRQTNRRRGGRRAVTAGRANTTAPVGGVSKSSKVARPVANKPTAPAPATGESKIIVSGLPSDVSEAQIKDYFGKTIGAVKRVFLTYGPTGQSRGVSTIIFSQPGSAVKAAEQLNGVKVDGRAMKIEVIVGASQVPPPKGIGERIEATKGKTKVQPKVATAKATTKATTRAAAAAGRGGRGRRGKAAGRGKPKTAEELDAEMVDYFDAAASGAATTTTTTANGANPAVATGGDTGMEDEIM